MSLSLEDQIREMIHVAYDMFARIGVLQNKGIPFERLKPIIVELSIHMTALTKLERIFAAQVGGEEVSDIIQQLDTLSLKIDTLNKRLE